MREFLVTITLLIGKPGTENLGTDGTFTDFHSSSDHLLREIYYNSWRK